VDPLQNTERFGNEIYSVICGNHSVTVIQSQQSKKLHIKHLFASDLIHHFTLLELFHLRRLFVVSIGRPSVPVLKATAKEGSSNIAQLVCTSEGNPKPTIRWYGNR